MNKFAVIATLVLVLIFGVLAWAGFHYYGKYAAELITNTNLIAENKANTAAVQNQASLTNLFNTISGATLNDQATNTTASQNREVVIQTVIKTEPCAVVVVPAAAADVLLEHYNQLRSSANSTDSGQPNSPVPAVTTTK